MNPCNYPPRTYYVWMRGAFIQVPYDSYEKLLENEQDWKYQLAQEMDRVISCLAPERFSAAEIVNAKRPTETMEEVRRRLHREYPL